jgi:anion-transporting  ArsA/GET3 family ATPase
VIVTGKGGVGKSTVAAALAQAAQAAGRRVLAVDVDGSGLAALLGHPDAALEPRLVAPRLHVAGLEPRAALTDFVRGLLPLPLLSRRLLESTTFQIVAAAAPGLPEFLVLRTIGTWLEAKRGRRGRWDLIVVDAPASGHSLPLLATPHTLGTLARIGPIADTMARMDRTLRDPSHSAIWLVTLPEELSVRETIELHASLTSDPGLPVAPPVVNAVLPPRFTAADARAIEHDERDGEHPVILGARLELARRRAALAQLAKLRHALGRTPVRLPFRPAGPSGADLGGLVRTVGRAAGLSP